MLRKLFCRRKKEKMELFNLLDDDDDETLFLRKRR